MLEWLFWTVVQLAVVVGASYAIAELTKKKPEDTVTEPDTFKFPEIKEGTKYSIIAGTCWIENPIVAWYGDVYDEALVVRLSDTDGQYVIIHRYWYAALFILCQGVTDGIIQTKLGDDIIWPSPYDYTWLDSDGRDYIISYYPELYGGIHEHNAQISGQGGIQIVMDFRYGEMTQGYDAYLVSLLGSDISCNRGLTTVTMHRSYIGLSTQLKPFKFLLKRVLHLTTGEAQWYPAKAAIRIYEINPIHWLRETYTDIEWGLKTPTNLLNDTTWRAAADTLYDEGFGICIKWEGEQSLESHIKGILRCINAKIYEDHETGFIEIKLIRDDYVSDDLEEFNETDIVSIDKFSRNMMHKTPSVTYAKFWNYYDNLPRVLPNYDVGLSASQSETNIPNDVSYTEIVNSELAGKLAARDQQQIASFPAMMTLKCKRTMAHLKPGDVFKLVYTTREIISMIVRVVEPHYGTLEDGTVTLICIEDIFGMKDSLYADPPNSEWTPPSPTPTYIDEYMQAEVALSGTDPTVTII